MGPIDPIRPVRLVRRQPRPDADERDEAAVVNVTVNVAPAQPAEPPQPYQPPTNLDAHLIAQDNRRRGLRGGQPVLDAARSAYLGTEYSGPNDRRHHAGEITRTEI